MPKFGIALIPMIKTKTYYSKKGKLLGIIIWLPVIVMLFFFIKEKVWLGILFIFFYFIFVGIIWFRTRYIIVNNKLLLIRIGPYTHSRFDIEKIKSIKRTKTMFASPANSMDRIEILDRNANCVFISPNNKQAFVKELLKINPTIETNVI